MTPKQIGLARHALGLPNQNNESYRNHFCATPGSEDHAEWEKMVSEKLAVKRIGPQWGGSDMFYLTLNGALPAIGPKEHLNREDAANMRALEVEEDV